MDSSGVRNPSSDEGVRGVDGRHPLEVDVGLAELWADEVYVVGHAAQDGVGDRVGAVATGRLVAVEFLDPLKVYHRNNADLEVHVLAEIDVPGHDGAVQPLVEQQVRTLFEVLPVGEISRLDAAIFGFQLVVDIVARAAGAAVSVGLEHSLKF